MKVRTLVLLVVIFGLSRALFFIDVNLNSATHLGTVEPRMEQGYLAPFLNASLGVTAPLQLGAGFTVVTSPLALDIGMNDGNTYAYTLMAYGPALSLGVDKGLFYVHSCPTIAVFKPTKGGEFLETDYSSHMDKPIGVLFPVSAGLKFGPFYAGGLVAYTAWSSAGSFTKSEWDLWQGWHEVASGNAQCEVKGISVGLTLGLRFKF